MKGEGELKMESVIRKLTKEELGDLWEIKVSSFPGFGYSREQKEAQVNAFSRSMDESENSAFYGMFREEKLLGIMALLDFRIKLLSTAADMGGVGMVSVDFLHKKEKVAMDMISFFINHYREKGVSLVALYPFRTDFYRNMGFGYGAKIHQYRIKPDSFPKGKSKENIDYISPDEKQAMLQCYNRYQQKTNGLIEKALSWLDYAFGPNMRVVGYKKDGKILGYIVFSFKSTQAGYDFMNDMFIHEFVYETPEALMELCTFLHSQSDQINRVIVKSMDDNFHYIIGNPENGCNDAFNTLYQEAYVTGIGVMYRVVNVKGIFKDLCGHNFNGQSCKLKITVKDNFLKSNDGSIFVEFKDGKAEVREDGDFEAEIIMSISDFSSMIMGAIDFKSLYRYGLASVSDCEYIDVVNRTFQYEQKPVCSNHF